MAHSVKSSHHTPTQPTPSSRNNERVTGKEVCLAQEYSIYCYANVLLEKSHLPSTIVDWALQSSFGSEWAPWWSQEQGSGFGPCPTLNQSKPKKTTLGKWRRRSKNVCLFWGLHSKALCQVQKEHWVLVCLAYLEEGGLVHGGLVQWQGK